MERVSSKEGERGGTKHRGGMEWKRRKWWASRIARTCVFSPRKVSSRAKTERNRACIRSVRASNEKYRLQSSRQGRTTRGTKQNRARSINARSSSQPLRVTTAVDTIRTYLLQCIASISENILLFPTKYTIYMYMYISVVFLFSPSMARKRKCATVYIYISSSPRDSNLEYMQDLIRRGEDPRNNDLLGGREDLKRRKKVRFSRKKERKERFDE